MLNEKGEIKLKIALDRIRNRKFYVKVKTKLAVDMMLSNSVGVGWQENRTGNQQRTSITLLST